MQKREGAEKLGWSRPKNSLLVKSMDIGRGFGLAHAWRGTSREMREKKYSVRKMPSDWASDPEDLAVDDHNAPLGLQVGEHRPRTHGWTHRKGRGKPVH